MSVTAGAQGVPPSSGETRSGLGLDEPQSLELLLPGRNVPLGFVRDGDVVDLVGGNRSARWPVELLREGRAMLSISDAQVEGSAELITDPLERRDTLDRFRARYGPEQYARWYENAARVLRVRLGVPRAPADGGERYYGWLASEFDNIADDYDRHILGNRINRLLRDRSLAELRRVFGRASRLLEIGCGSGMETLPLLGEGHEIFCVDISERMLEVVRQKARKQGVAERLQTAKLAAAALPQFLDQVGPVAFDGAYSTYGAMNCEADLAPLPPALHGLLRPGARFIAGVYNRWCAFELLGYPSPAGSTGRSGAPVDRYGSAPPGSASMSTPTRRRRSGEIFAPWFVRERLAAAPVLLPPSDLVAYVERFQRHFAALERFDRVVAARWPFSLRRRPLSAHATP